MNLTIMRSACIALLALGLTACSGAEDEAGTPSGPRATPVTTAAVATETVHVREESLGTVHTTQAPSVAAEIGARVIAIHVDEGVSVSAGTLLAELDGGDFVLARDRSRAEIERLTALIENQQRQVERNRRMFQQNLVAESVVDEAETQLRALQGQLAAEQANLGQAERNLRRTRVTAPVDGRIEARLANSGDWVAVGEPMFRIATDAILRAHLPYPEYVADRLRPGLSVSLRSPAAPGVVVEGTITELRPMIGATRAVIVIAEFANPGGWRAGASVNGTVVIDSRDGAIMVPEISVVHRPAGQVVYVVEDDKARQRLVRTGHRQNGKIEITEGLDGDEQIVVDGAGFLTDGATLRIRESGS